MTLPDCSVCGGPVRPDVDEERGAIEACAECGLAQRPVPVFTGIRRAVRESRRRRLLGPSCLGRRHSRCSASGCECTCHDKTKGATSAQRG